MEIKWTIDAIYGKLIKLNVYNFIYNFSFENFSFVCQMNGSKATEAVLCDTSKSEAASTRQRFDLLAVSSSLSQRLK